VIIDADRMAAAIGLSRDAGIARGREPAGSLEQPILPETTDAVSRHISPS